MAITLENCHSEEQSDEESAVPRNCKLQIPHCARDDKGWAVVGASEAIVLVCLLCASVVSLFFL